jgi:hypothetical protein
MQISQSTFIRYGAVLAAGIIILAVYLTTLQTIPNGSSHPYMIDVGETQVALNVWGTLHATGYPLYTVLGNFFTPLPELLGVNPAAASSLFSVIWTLLALGGFYVLLNRLTGKRLLSAASLLVLALTRSVWIHSVIAEVYTMSLAILIGLWLLVIWKNGWSLERRVQALALLGSIGVAHHRALMFVAPALIFALWPQLRANTRQLPGILLTSIPFVMLGFLQYLYLPLAAHAGSDWVYGNVGTWDGFWFTFWGHEADYLITRPTTLQGWIDNFDGTIRILEPTGACVCPYFSQEAPSVGWVRSLRTVGSKPATASSRSWIIASVTFWSSGASLPGAHTFWRACPRHAAIAET